MPGDHDEEEANLVLEDDGIFLESTISEATRSRRWFRSGILCVLSVAVALVVLFCLIPLPENEDIPTIEQEHRPKLLPPGDQTWSHATNTKEMLREAVTDPEITAIEMDLLMGYDVTVDPLHEKRKIPICSHPPETDSDLSVATVVEMITSTSSSDDGVRTRSLLKHLKLDFKELEVVQSALDLFTNGSFTIIPTDNVIYLNADILPGPGHREGANFDADAFVSTCLSVIEKSDFPFAFSLGFRVERDSETGYTTEDLASMTALINKYNVMERSAGVVLAINARLLVKDMVPFDSFLEGFPTAQILVWTGSGEPPIPRQSIDSIKQHFEGTNTSSRIGFDCKIEE